MSASALRDHSQGGCRRSGEQGGWVAKKALACFVDSQPSRAPYCLACNHLGWRIIYKLIIASNSECTVNINEVVFTTTWDD